MLSPYLADVAPLFPFETASYYSYCFRLNNLANHSNYLILAQQFSWGKKRFSPYFVITSGDCLPMSSSLPVLKLIALPKAKVMKTDLIKLPPYMVVRVHQGNLVQIDANKEDITEKQSLIWFPVDRTVLRSFNLVEARGVPASEEIIYPRRLPFFYEGRTIEDHYTITAITGNSFAIKQEGYKLSWSWIDFIVLPLLGIILLFMVKWSQRRLKHKSSNTTSSKPISS